MAKDKWHAPDPLERLCTAIGGEAILGAVRDRAHRRLLTILGESATDRKLRLFAVAVCRRIAPGLLIRAAWEALDAAEMVADGSMSLDELSMVRAEMLEYLRNDTSYQPSEYAACAPRYCLEANIRDAVRYTISSAWCTSQPPRDKVWASDTTARLRDIFGNPFRPVAFDPEWRTDTTVSLARHMYESRDFSAMPVLADALQDAGCDADAILAHCREPQQVHVRGCWVVDLVLGRE